MLELGKIIVRACGRVAKLALKIYVVAHTNAVSVHASDITEASCEGQPQATVHRMPELQADIERRTAYRNLRVYGEWKLF